MRHASRTVRATTILLLTLAGCARIDAVVAPPGPELALFGAAQASSYPLETEYSGASSSIVWVVTVAQAWFGGIAHANASAQTQGWGNAGSQSLVLDVFEGSQQLHQTSPSLEAFTTGLPYPWSLRDTVLVNISFTCGLSSTATSTSTSALKVLPVGGVTAFTLFEKTKTGIGHGYMNACPPPSSCDNEMTDEVEQCGDEGANTGTVYRPGGSHNTEEPGIDFGGSATSVQVCWVTDWYISSDGGQTWQYDGTDIIACWLEGR